LLEFMDDLENSYPDRYKCTSFELELPSWINMSSEQACLLTEIAKITPLITTIHHFEMKNFLTFRNGFTIERSQKSFDE